MREVMFLNLISSFKNTLFNKGYQKFGDSLIGIAEVGLDSILEDGVLKDIPILSTIASLCRAGVNIKERNLIKQTASFITSFNNGTISDEELSIYRVKLESDPRRAEKELGRVLLLLDKTIEEKQSEILGVFYRSYVKGIIKWEMFSELSEVNSRMFISDYSMLDAICRKPIKQSEDITDRVMYRIQRLESLGLVIENRARLHSGNMLSYPNTDDRFVSAPLGGTFFSLVRSSLPSNE